MINKIKSKIRGFARNHFLTANTLRYRIEVRMIAELLDEVKVTKPNDLTLDAGAGSGEMSVRLQKLGCFTKLVGVEPDPVSYAMLKQRYGKLGFDAYQGGLEKLPIEDNLVDGVISTQVFEHIEDDRTAASEVSRVLKDGGYAIISTPHPPEIFPNDGHIRPGYTVEEMSALFKPVGLEYVGHRYFFTLPTLRRLMAADELGLIGRLTPIGWGDRELNLTQEEIKEQQPYGIVCVFKKKSIK